MDVEAASQHAAKCVAEIRPAPCRRNARAVHSSGCQVPSCQRHRPRHDHHSGTGARRHGSSPRSSSHPKGPRNRRNRRELQVRRHWPGFALSRASRKRTQRRGLDGQPSQYDTQEAQRQPARGRLRDRKRSGKVYPASGRICRRSTGKRTREIDFAIFASVHR